MNVNVANLTKGSQGLTTLICPCLGDLIGYVHMSRETKIAYSFA